MEASRAAETRKGMRSSQFRGPAARRIVDRSFQAQKNSLSERTISRQIFVICPGPCCSVHVQNPTVLESVWRLRSSLFRAREPSQKFLRLACTKHGFCGVRSTSYLPQKLVLTQLHPSLSQIINIFNQKKLKIDYLFY